MPFTTKEIVRKHILEHHIGSTIIIDERLSLTGADACRLRNRPVLISSEVIKAREQDEPQMESVSFAGGDDVPLQHERIIQDSVVVSSDSSLGRIFVEHVDYQIDYQHGTIQRLSDGDISAQVSLTIWYLPYRIYQRGVDYDVDYSAGSIRRRASGAIESGQWVLADYTAEYGSFDDTVIDNAIAEADEQVLAFIDRSYRNSTEKGLVIGETYLSVAIICRIRAMESMGPSGGSVVATRDAQSWAAVADIYRKEAYNLLANFSASRNAFNPPSKA
jgi:hypothetical protein